MLHLITSKMRPASLTRLAAVAGLAVVLIHNREQPANAGLIVAADVQHCDADTIGQETQAANLRLAAAMELGDWRMARRTVDELLPLIGNSMPAEPIQATKEGEETGPTEAPEKLLRSCVPDALLRLKGLFATLELESLRDAADEAASHYVRSVPATGATEAARSAQRKSAAAFDRLIKLVASLDKEAETQARETISVWHELTSSPLVFETTGTERPPCTEASTRKVRALVIGKAKLLTFNLNGPQNDVQLMKTSLLQRGVAEEDITVLMDDEAQRDEVVGALRGLVEKTACGDFVLFFYSGGGGPATNLAGLRSILLLGRAGMKEPNNEAVLWGHEISEFITAIANRRASVVVVLDMNEASGLDIGIHQQLAGSVTTDNWTGETVDFSRLLHTGHIESTASRLAPGHGDYAVFYGAKPGQVVPDGIPFQNGTAGDATNYGIFSYAFATALQSLERPTVRALAREIAQSFSKLAGGRQITPVFETSNPNMVFLGTGRAGELDVEILEPKALRGGFVIETEEESFTLLGRLEQPETVRVLTVNNEQVSFDASGRFEVRITLQPGGNEITIATTDAFDRYLKKTITFDYKGNLKRFTAQGMRYALVIGNEDYEEDNAFPDLTTPHEDAEEVARVLSTQFGFKTEIEVSGKPHSLLLKDASRNDINRSLNLLRRNLTKYDVLIIYYAGHGEILEETGDAFWVPVDGRHDEDTSWLAADDLRRALKRMKARSVLIVADSCFSGAMSRAPRELRYFDPENRERALKKAAELQSRVFMTSGGEEPVQDVDRLDSGHSPFAGAFLHGLRTMAHDVFSTRELFDVVYGYVYGNNPQEPQFRQLKDSGHLGGDFVFTRVMANEASAD